MEKLKKKIYLEEQDSKIYQKMKIIKKRHGLKTLVSDFYQIFGPKASGSLYSVPGPK